MPETAGQANHSPDYVLYDSFFFRVNWFDQQARKRLSEGRDPERFTSAIRKRAGLTDREDEILKSVATDWQARISELAAKARALKAQEAQSANPALQDLLDQRKQITLDHIGELRAAFAPARFQRLDGFIRATSTVKAYEVVPSSK
jgi:hypothetical protein